MRTALAVMIGLLSAIALGACLPTAGTRPPDWSKPEKQWASPDERARLTRFFEPCHLSASVDPKKRAFSAIVFTLHDRSWTIKVADVAGGTLSATKCYRNQPGRCTEVAFECDALGTVNVKPVEVDSAITSDLERWLIELEDTYAKYRCYTDAVLQEEMKKLGVTL